MTQDIDPLYDYHAYRPLTSEQIRVLYLKFRKSYYDLLSERALERKKKANLYRVLKQMDWRAVEVNDEERLLRFFREILSENEKLKNEIREMKNALPAWKRLREKIAERFRE